MTEVSSRSLIKSMNYNVRLVFLFYIFASFGRGIWMGNVLSTYIYLIANESSQILGLTSAATGITMTIFVFPAGYLADKFRRDMILRVAAVIGVAGLFIILFGNNIVYIFVALLLWGIFQGLTRPSIEAIFADSIESGCRSRIYSWAHLARQFAMAAGPFINVGLFFIFGDEWDLSILKKVMLVGLIITFVSLAIMFLFKDQKSLGRQSEAIPEEVTLAVEEKSSGYFINMSAKRATKLIPILLVGSNIIIGFGAGMTIKFFPIFFMEVYLLSPIWIQVIMGFTAIFTGLSGILAQKLSLKRGRVQMIFIVQFIATICLGVIAIYPPLYLLAPIFVARGSLMNAAQPLSRSILMDVIPKRQRAKWNSLETIAWGLFWNVSAVIGGFLVGTNNNFRLCFFVTTGLYLAGGIPILFLIPLVGRERLAQKELALASKNIDKGLFWAAENYDQSLLDLLSEESKEIDSKEIIIEDSQPTDSEFEEATVTN